MFPDDQAIHTSSTDRSTPLIDAALAYAARGWSVLPLRPGQKSPATEHGLKDASTDPAVIARWWARWPESNIGLRTGEAFDALDIDSFEALARLCDASAVVGDRAPLLGPTVTTPRGWHVYFAPTGRGNTVRLGGIDGVDWRGAGGYVVAPPSSLEGGRGWVWSVAGSMISSDAPIRPAPGWITDLFSPPEQSRGATPPPRREQHAGRMGYGLRALNEEAADVARAEIGHRNNRLNIAAFRAGQLVAAGLLDPLVVVTALLEAAYACGLPEAEASATIQSGLRAGMAHPRQGR